MAKRQKKDMHEIEVRRQENPERKKMLVTASTFPRWEKDTEPRFILDYAKAMGNYYDVTVLAPAAPGAAERELLEGVKVIRYHYFPIHQWETLCYPGAIVPRIKEKKIRILLVPFLLLSLYIHLFRLLPSYDFVHAHWLIPQGIVQSFFKKPYLVTGHGGDVTSLNKGLLGRLKIRALKKAKAVTVVSDHLKKKVQELVPELEPEVISMGVDASRFGKQYRGNACFGQSEKKVVLFVGRLVEIKGVSYLIEAMKSIDALLVIVGDGPKREELEIQAGELGDKVVFLGSKSHDELKQIYASSDVFVMPSVTMSDGAKEGFGLVILEAMASGLVVVASDSGGIGELIRNQENGLLCRERDVDQLAKAIKEALDNEVLAERLRSRSLKTVERFDYASIGQRYRNVL